MSDRPQKPANSSDHKNWAEDASKLIKEIKSYVGFEPRHRDALLELQPVLDRCVDQLMDRFYERLLGFTKVNDIMQEGGYRLEDMRCSLREWALSLVSGVYDDSYARNRLNIGLRHVVIGVQQRITAGAFGIMRDLFRDIILDEFGNDAKKVLELVEAVDKILDIDVSLISETFHGAERAIMVGEKEEESRGFSERLQGIASSDHVLLFSLTSDGAFTAVNKLTTKLLGWTVGDIIWENINSPEEEVMVMKKFIDRCFKENQPPKSYQIYSHPMHRSSGEILHISWSASQIHDAEGEITEVLLLGYDITEQRLLQEQVVQQEKLAAIGLLASGVAHEIGNPLASISSVAQTLKRKVSDPYVSEKLDLVGTHITRITTIVRQMVDIARPPRHEWRTCSIHYLLQNTMEILRYGDAARGVQLDFDLASDIATIYAVEDQIAQVFFNIAANALDALSECSEDKPRLKITTKSCFNERGPVISVCFEDNGPGFSEEQGKRLFEPFYTSKEVGKGTGLGLTVSYRIILDHGGRIIANAIPGKGASFTIELPVKQKSENES